MGNMPKTEAAPKVNFPNDNKCKDEIVSNMNSNQHESPHGFEVLTSGQEKILV